MIRLIILHSKKVKSNVKNTSYIGVLFFAFCVNIYGQNEIKKQPLAAIIYDLEYRYPFQFTYANDVIENIVVISPHSDLTFEEALSYLEKETHLIFTILANNFVSINKRNKSLVICGEIKTSIGTPIQSATIQSENVSAISNEQGYFELEIKEDQKNITIDHLGYQTLTLSITSFQNESCLTIYPEPKTIDLQEIILKNYITKGISKTNVGGFKIDYSNFGILPGLIETDVLQTIQALPGVQSADETVSNINIRGGTHDQNLIMWDGIKMYQSGHFFGLISVFNPNITSKATLIKNGTHSEHTDGVSGTIIMNSDAEVNSDFSASIGVNMINVDAFADIPIGKKSSLQLSTRKSINEFLKTPTYSSYFDRISQDSELDSNNEEEVSNSDIEFDFYDTNVRWNYKFSDRDKVRANFLLINNDLVFTENTTINSEPVSRQSNIIQSSIAGGIWYERNWNKNFISSLQLYETDYRLKSTNANLQQGQRFLQENKVSETGVKLNTSYKLNRNVVLQNGYQFIETGITNLNDVDVPIFIEEQVRVIRTHGIFSQANYKTKNKRLFLSLGVRYTYNEKFNTHFVEPRVRYNQRIGKYINLEVQGEFKHQNTSQVINFQNDFLGIEKRRWILANDVDIPVIKSKQISSGLQYNRKGWLITVEGYYKMINGITARSQGFQNQYEFVRSIGDFTVSGLEFLVNKRFVNISTWLSYSYANNEYAFETFKEREFPNNIDIKHSITWGGAYSFRGFKISAGLNWNSGLPTTRPVMSESVVEEEINYDRANSDRLQEYFRLDFSAVYDFNLTKRIKAHTGVSVWNVTNNKNTITNYYSLNEEKIPQETRKTTLGVTPNVVFRVSF
ncbi:TonB-dependent receptor [Aquimarina sp. AU58]|uniref:TonB-dependent receptor n=1 Tax=Aquimarina sp. AU58 TaxID=1874112 RepID=UPI001359C108|nr:TonB-dependent receptor [Aquimarina sp. AU58]